MKILIIEDEFKLADMIKDNFNMQGDEVHIATDGLSGYAEAKSCKYDVIILDVMLPYMDGYDILKNIRSENINTPVIMLTAKNKLEDKLKGFELGALDYLTKPFDMPELEARVRILSGKIRATEDKNKLSVGDLVLDITGYELFCQNSGKSMVISAKEFSLLELFMENANHVLTKEIITEKIWGYEYEAEYNHEEVYISFLRKKLKAIESECKIETIRGVGYKFVRQ